MRNLIASASPRYIDEVLEPRKHIECDQFFAKRYHEGAAYRRIKEYFLEHTEYDGYLIIAPDDLIVTNKHYILLDHDILTGQYPVISGVCNVNRGELRDRYAASAYHNPNYYYFGYLGDSDFSEEKPIMNVTWSGFSFTWLRRDIVKKLSFTGMPGGRVENEGCSFDTKMSLELFDLKIPQYIDHRARMKHLQGAGMVDIEKIGREGYEPYDQFSKN